MVTLLTYMFEGGSNSNSTNFWATAFSEHVMIKITFRKTFHQSPRFNTLCFVNGLSSFGNGDGEAPQGCACCFQRWRPAVAGTTS
jgi:hypothetical protein